MTYGSSSHEARQLRERVRELESRITALEATTGSLDATRYQYLFETVPSGIVFYDADGKIVDANAAAEHLLGRSHAQLSGRTSVDLQWRTIREDGSEIPLDEQPSRVALRTGQPVRDVVIGVYNPMEEAYHWLLVNAVPMLAEEGTPTGAYATFSDITHQIVREYEATQTHALLVDNLHDLICRHTPDGTYTWVSPSAHKLLGYKPEELISKTPYDFVSPDDRASAKAEFLNPGNLRQQDTSLRYRFQRKEGTWIWLEVRKKAITAKGELLGWQTCARDITQQREAEQALQRSQALFYASLYSMPANVAVLNQQGTIIAVSKEWEHFARTNGGLQGRQGVGVNYLDVCSLAAPQDEDAYTMKHGIEAVLRGDRKRFEHVYPCHSPTEERWFLACVVPLGYPDGGAIVAHVNLTGQKKTERALRESEARYRAIYDNTPALLHSIDADGRIISVSNYWLDQMGYTREEVLGRTSTSFLTPASQQKAQLLLKAFFTSGQIRNIDYQFLRKDGSTMDVLLSAVVEKDEEGNPQRAIAVLADVTERNRVEKAWADSRERLEMAILGADLGTWDADLETEKNYFNRQWAEMLGYTLEEVSMHMAFFKAIAHPDDFPILFQRIQEHVEHKTPFFEIELRLKAKGGSWRWVLNRGRVISYQADGQPKRVVGTHMDITERKRDEAKIRASEELLRNFFTSAAIGVCLWDIDGNCLRTNPAFCTMLGYTEAELIGTHFLPYTHPNDAAPGQKRFNSLIRGECEQYQFEKRFIHKQGHDVWARGTVSMHSMNGEPVFTIGLMEDITERKYIEARLQREEALLRQAADMLRLGGWEVDVETRQPSWSDEVRRIYDVPVNMHVDLDVAFGFYHPEDQQRLEQAYEHCIREGRDFDDQYRFTTYTGNPMWVRVKGEAVRKSGRTVKVRGILQDVTKEYERHERLRLLESAVQHTNDAVVVTDANIEEGVGVIYVNPAYERITGYSAQEVMGGSPRRLQGDGTDALTRARIRMALRRNKPIREEILNYTKAGQPFWNELHIAPVKDHAGTVTHWVSVQRDITERKRIEAELKHLSTRLSLAVRSGDIGIWDLDVVTDTLVWDARMYALYGVDPESFAGAYDAWIQGIHPDDVDIPAEAVRQALAGQKPLDTEFRIVRPIGQVRHIKAYAIVQHDAHGEPIRMVGINYDVTDQKRKEAELVQAKEAAEEMNRIKTVFLSNMSHELRTPLVGILGFAEIIQTEAPDHLQEFAGYIVSSGQRLLEIFNALLDLSQLESNQLKKRSETCFVEQIVNTALLRYKPEAQEKGVRVHMEVLQPALTFEGDQRFVQSIVSHLLSNAVKFTTEGQITVRLWEEEGYACMEVADTGIGMDPAFMGRMYDPFIQESSGDARVYAGGGIGLTLTKRYVEMLGGSITVQSVRHQGTSFTCRFPKGRW